MTKRTLVPLSILIFLLGFTGYAQEDKLASKEERLVTKANEQYRNYSFSPAIDIYKRILDKGYTSADLLKKLGNSYYFNANYDEAAKIYKRLVDEYPSEMGPEYYFRYSQTLKSLGDYENSNATMSKFIEITSEDVRAKAFEGEKDYLADIKKRQAQTYLSEMSQSNKIKNRIISKTLVRIIYIQ